MDREIVRQEVRQNWRTLIKSMTTEAKQPANREASYICPVCGHGTHGDGMTFNPKSRDGNGLHCFSCGFSGDIIDLYQKVNGGTYNDVLSTLAGELGLTVDPYKPGGAGGRRSHVQKAHNTQGPVEKKTQQTGSQAATRDFADYYAECRARLNDPAAVSYLTGRGISMETAAAYWVGFDPAADPAESGHPTPRIIIPSTMAHYVARSIDPSTPKRYAKMNPKGSSPDIFNSGVMYTQGVQEVFVVEGVFDALSLLEFGASAVALNSLSNADILLKMLKKRRTEATLILCLDNDPDPNTKAKVEKVKQTILAGCKRLNIACIVGDICGKYKDANDFLRADKAGFVEAVQGAQQEKAPKPDNTRTYIDSLMGSEIEAFRSNVQTGFENLDQKCGELHAGLYVLAAVSSLGKTTFALQMADQIAAAGTDVLFFSLEQSRLEMVSKSLARITAQNDITTAVTSLSIRKGYISERVQQAAQQYKEQIADRMSVIEGNFNCNISFIGDYVRRYIKRNDVKPVVIIDYLQILQPETDRTGRGQTTKEVVDTTVTALKRISRELGLTIIAISSVNRSNYLTPVDFESLKESGNIEYTADVVWGLQLHCLSSDAIFSSNSDSKITEKRKRVNDEKAKNPRSIDLVCLKNRYGVSSFTCSFEYYPVNDLFKPIKEPTTTSQNKKARLVI